MKQRHQAGFTLTEMMIVVAIVGVLATLAVVYMRPRTRPIDAANRVGDLVREASRRAVALGPVRAEVAVELRTRARTEIRARPGVLENDVIPVIFEMYRLEEAPTGNLGTWIGVESYKVDTRVKAVKWGPVPGAVPGDPPTTSENWSNFVVRCSPDGTCDPRTLFFEDARPAAQRTGGTYELLAKLTILPLGGAINTRPDWN
jgi:prepilin-type N-terminal cleavage/methylation domain-containing protein